MPSTCIRIVDRDRNVEYELTVSYDISRGRHGFWDRLFRNSEPGALELNSALCTEIVVWCGDYGVSASPSDEERGEKRVGAWCLERYAESIELAVEESLAEELS